MAPGFQGKVVEELMEGTKVIVGARRARAVCEYLLWRSCWFEMTPLPDDRYEFRVKSEEAAIFDQAEKDRSQPQIEDEAATYWERRFNSVEFNWPHIETFAALVHSANVVACSECGNRTIPTWGEMSEAAKKMAVLSAKLILDLLWQRFGMLGLAPGEYQLEDE